jgi:hypothetical protein
MVVMVLVLAFYVAFHAEQLRHRQLEIIIYMKMSKKH